MRHFPAIHIGSLRFNIVSSTLGYMGYGAAQWAMLIVLARLATPEAVGQFSLAFAITAPVFLAFDMQLKRVVASDASHRISPWAALSVRVSGCAIATAAITVVSGYLNYSSVQRDLNLTVAVAKSFESISDLLYGYFQRVERMHSVALSLLLKGVGGLAGLWAVMWQTGSVVHATAAVACAWFLLLVSFDAPRVRKFFRQTAEPGEVAPTISSWRPLVQMAGPLGIAMVLGSLGQNIPRYVLEARRGHAALGVYAAASYFFLVGGRLTMATADTILPRLSKLANTNLDEFACMLRKAIIPIVLLGIGLAIIAIPLARPLLVRLYGRAYAAGAATLVIVLLASSLHCVASIFQAALMALRQINVQVGIVAAGTLSALLVSAALVSSFGGTGAAIALAVGLGLQAVLSGAFTLAKLRSINEAPAADAPTHILHP
jgi:O-antigen/teichoic acid export membrane protein